MLINFKIKNYRSFKDEVNFTMEAESSKAKPQNYFEVPLPNENQLRLLKIAMIYGANASGKTNLIRAFYNLINYLFKKPQVNSRVWLYDPYLFDKKFQSQNAEFEVNFIGPESIKHSYQIIFNQNEIVSEILDYYPKGKLTNLFKRQSDPDITSNIHTGILGPYLSKTNKKEIKVFSNQLLLSKFGNDEPIAELTNVFLYFKKYEAINAANKLHQTAIKNQLDQLFFSEEKLKLKLNSLVRFADTKLNGFNIYNVKEDANFEKIKASLKDRIEINPYLVYGVHNVYEEAQETEETQQIHFENESMGTQILYSLGGKVLLTLQNGGVLIVDEFDTSLHPFLTRMLVLMFQSEKLNPQNAQLIFTSHDMTLLDRDIIRKDQVWIAEKNQYGASDLFSLQDFESVREETPFDKWYLAGKFGGLPTIKSVDTIFENE